MQFKVFHDRLTTNPKLYKVYLINDLNCTTRCNNNIETIANAFGERPCYNKTFGDNWKYISNRCIEAVLKIGDFENIHRSF